MGKAPRGAEKNDGYIAEKSTAYGRHHFAAEHTLKANKSANLTGYGSATRVHKIPLGAVPRRTTCLWLPLHMQR